MAARTLTITVVSASNLENVQELLQLKAYAIISVAGVEGTEIHTPMDLENGTNPVWNFTTAFTVDETALYHEGVSIVVQVYCHYTLGDRYIGEVTTSFKPLHDDDSKSNGGAWTTVVYRIHKGFVESQGELTLSYTFGDHDVYDEMQTFWEKLGRICSCCEKTSPRAGAVVRATPDMAKSDSGSKWFSIGSKWFGSGSHSFAKAILDMVGLNHHVVLF